MDCQLQVITLPVGGVDKAKAFYTQQAGFAIDVDYHPAAGFRVVQLTPPGSACSVQIGTGLTDAAPGTVRQTYLVVTDIEAARSELTARGVTVSSIRHKSPIDDWTGGFQPGADPQRRDYASFATSPTRTATPGSSRRSGTGQAGARDGGRRNARRRTARPGDDRAVRDRHG